MSETHNAMEVTNAGAWSFIASLHLPQGATLDELRCFYKDNNGFDSWQTIKAEIKRRAYSSDNASSVGDAVDVSTSAPGFSTTIFNTSADLNDALIDNSAYSYYLEVDLKSSCNSCSNILFYGCRVTYEAPLL